MLFQHPTHNAEMPRTELISEHTEAGTRMFSQMFAIEGSKEQWSESNTL